MAEITESIDVAVPVSTAYNQWTQFEEFPQFMEGLQSVTQLDDTHLRWVAEIGGKREEWEAEITEQHPEERVAWKAVGGKGNAGVVTFHRLDEEQTRGYSPVGLAARRRDRERRNGSRPGRPSGVQGFGPIQRAD